MGHLTEKIESQIDRWIRGISVETQGIILGKEDLRS